MGDERQVAMATTQEMTRMIERLGRRVDELESAQRLAEGEGGERARVPDLLSSMNEEMIGTWADGFYATSDTNTSDGDEVEWDTVDYQGDSYELTDDFTITVQPGVYFVICAGTVEFTVAAGRATDLAIDSNIRILEDGLLGGDTQRSTTFFQSREHTIANDAPGPHNHTGSVLGHWATESLLRSPITAFLGPKLFTSATEISFLFSETLQNDEPELVNSQCGFIRLG